MVRIFKNWIVCLLSEGKMSIFAAGIVEDGSAQAGCKVKGRMIKGCSAADGGIPRSGSC